MRVVKELSKEDIRISIFSWNNKYLVKFESGPLEQTFKVNSFDVLDEEDLSNFLCGTFFDEVKQRFEEMGNSLRDKLAEL